MFSILISEKGGETKRMEFDRPEITIGRVAGNDIVLPRNNISKRHSRIVFKDGKFIVVDLKSTNGTFVNGRKITGTSATSSSLSRKAPVHRAARLPISRVQGLGKAGFVHHHRHHRAGPGRCRRFRCVPSRPAWICQVVM